MTCVGLLQFAVAYAFVGIGYCAYGWWIDRRRSRKGP